MKILMYIFVLLLISSNLTVAQKTTYQKIEEVYGASFMNDNPTLVQSFSKLLEERIKYVQTPEIENEKYPKISSLGLQNKNNQGLTVDTVFDESTFNPLKYGIQMFAPTKQVYRIDNTDFLMLIEPQNN